MRPRPPVARVRLADLSFMERFAFCGSWWRPGSTSHRAADCRWSSWREYFDGYRDVRDELLAGRAHGWPPFAEIARRHYEANPARFNPDAAAAEYHEAQTRASRKG